MNIYFFSSLAQSHIRKKSYVLYTPVHVFFCIQI